MNIDTSINQGKHDKLVKNLKVFLVGGAVRDELLGLPVKEKDWVVVGSSEKEMLSLGFQKVGKDFPVFIHPSTGEEYALARTERKTAKGYYGFSCDFSSNVTLEQDLFRRDLTINAMAKDLEGNLIDPFNGYTDLQKKKLKHVSPAFVEDPIRILRAARFAANFLEQGFSIAEETMNLMKIIVNNRELEYVTPERVWKEIEKALRTNNPEEFFISLRLVGALEYIFPELNKLYGIPQNPVWHPEIDTWIHTMLALKQAIKFTKNPKIRFAVLCHDLGKGTTDQNILPKHHGHEERGVDLITHWCNRFKVPNAYKKLAIKVAKWHLHSHKAFELNPKTILNLYLSLDAFRNPTILEDFLIACKADATGREGKQNLEYLPEDFLIKTFEIISNIKPQPFIDKGLVGVELGEEIRKFQLKLITEFKKNFTIN